MGKDFVHLHVHTCYSLLDGLTKIPELFDKVAQLNQSAVAITDHGVMYAMVDAAKYAQKNNQHFIPGCEVYWVPDATVKDKSERSSENDASRKHFLLLAKNNEGYKKLMKICSWGCSDGYYYRPRIDDSIFEKYGTDGIIAASACLAGIPAQKLLHDDYKGAKESILHYAKMFKDGYYIEIQPTEDERQVKINKGFIELSKELGIPCIATTDAHYLNKEDKAIHDILLCIQSGAKIKDPNRWSFPGNTYYIMSRDELTQAFQKNGHELLDQHIIEEAMNNTVDIANQCQVNFTFGKHYLPKVSPPSEEENSDLMRQYNVFETRRIAEVAKKNNISMEDAKNRLDSSSEYFRFLLIHGWHGLYAQGLLDERHLSLMFYETDVVLSMDFPSYFLILHDILSYCNTNGIGTGPARGCFQSNTLISLKDEQKYIQDVNIDDEVLTYDGYHKVLDKYEYDCDEDIIEIQTESSKIEGITKDHKVLGIRAKDYIPDKDYSIDELEWISIDDLQEDDYLIQY